jgi:adenosylhomocysteine nucleosidase
MRIARNEIAVCIIISVLCVFCEAASAAMEPELNSAPVMAILGAFDKEVTLLEDRLADRQQRTIEGIRFSSGRLNGRHVVVAWTGVGKVNAAMTTTLLIEHYKPRHVIFTGIAGAVNPELRPGDIVIAKKTAHHDMGTVWPEGLFFKGVKNRLDGLENPIFFPANEELLNVTQRAANRIDMESIETITGRTKPRIITGVVVTGDAFIASADKCAELRKRLDADAVEMEGAAVAQICYQRRIGCLVIRSMSDNADEGAVFDKQMFYLLAARNSADLVAEMVGLLGSAPSVERKSNGQRLGD